MLLLYTGAHGRMFILALISRSGAAADRRTPLKPGAQLDLVSPYAVPCTRRTESPTSLNYAKLCVELNYTGAAIGEMWDDLVIRHIVLEYFMLNRGFPRFRWENVCDRHVSCDRHDSCMYGFRQRRPCIDVQRTPIYVCIVSHVTVCLDGAHRKIILK